MKRTLLSLAVLVIIVVVGAIVLTPIVSAKLTVFTSLFESGKNEVVPDAATEPENGTPYDSSDPSNFQPVPPPEEKVIEINLGAVSWSERRNLEKLFKSRQFEKLESELDRYQKQFEENTVLDGKIRSAYLIFNNTKPQNEALLNDWVDHSRDAYMPYLARAMYYRTLGWESRGEKWASETSEDQFDGMRHYFGLALDDIERALRIKEDLLLAHRTKLDILLASGSEKDAHDAFVNAQSFFPATFSIYSKVLSGMRPRWGGSYEQMFYYANIAAKHVDKNPNLYFLSGKVYVDIADRLQQANKMDEALGALEKAFAYGEFSYFYWERGWKYRAMNNHEAAIADFTRALELDPVYAEAYRARIPSLVQLERYDEAFSDVAELNRLAEPCNKDVLRTYNWMIRKLSFKNRPVETMIPLANAFCPGEPTMILDSLKSSATVTIEKSYAVPQGVNSFGLTWYDNHLYVSSYLNRPGIYKLDPTTGKIQKEGHPKTDRKGAYAGLASDGTKLLHFQSGWNSEYHIVDPRTLENIDSVVLQSSQTRFKDIAYLDGSIFTIGEHYQNTPGDFRLLQFSPRGTLVNSYVFNWEKPDIRSFGLTADGEFIWVAGDRRLIKIDPENGNVLKQYNLPVSDVTGLAWDGKKFWLVTRTGKKIMSFKVEG